MIHCIQTTVQQTRPLRAAGFKVVERWACEVGREGRKAQTFPKTAPHAILYDFKAFADKNPGKKPTGTLMLENVHVPISVSIGDTLERVQLGPL